MISSLTYLYYIENSELHFHRICGMFFVNVHKNHNQIKFNDNMYWYYWRRTLTPNLYQYPLLNSNYLII